MSKRKILPILAVIFGVCLTGIGAYLILLAVWGYTKFGFELQERVLAFMFGVFGGIISDWWDFATANGIQRAKKEW